MIIFPSSCAQRAAKISFYFVFPNAAAVLPSSFCYVLLPIHPTPLAWLPARVLGFTTAFRPRCRPGKESSQESGARASFWRQALARRGGGRHSKAYLHTLLFHFHTLPANALWKVPSEFPPGRTEGGGRGEQRGRGEGRGWAGIEGPSLTVCQRLPGGGLPPPPAADTGVGPGTLPQGAPGAQVCAGPRALRALGRMPALGSSLPRGSSGQALGPRLPVCTLRSPAGKSRDLHSLPNDPGGFSSVRRPSFGQNLNVTFAKNK